MEFVYEVENNLPASLCEEIIRRYKDDDRKEFSKATETEINKNIRDTKVLSISDKSGWNDIDGILYEKLSEGVKQYKQYINRYCPKNIGNTVFKGSRDQGYHIQETTKNGFYDWHIDERRPDKHNIYRFLTCIWYLNTLDEDDGGCTEFWGGKKIRPKQGTLLLFPSTWSYMHRGAPLKNDVNRYTCVTWLFHR